MRFRALDGWRGLCALLVAVYHLNVASHYFLTPLRINSYIFVDFFFVLSGFVIAHSYASRPMTPERTLAFLFRRLGRLWPLHASVLVVLVAMEGAKLVFGNPAADYRPFGIDAVSPWAIPTNLLMIHALDLHTTLTWNFVSWSISAEFWAYVIFAATLAALPRSRLMPGFLALAVAAGLLLTRTPWGMESVADFALLRCAYGFFAGCFLSSLLADRRFPQPWSGGTLAEVAIVAATLAFVCLGGHTQAGFAAPLVFGLVVLVFSREEGAISRLLLGRPLQRLGEISYSIYLVHILVLALISRLKLLQPFVTRPVGTLRHFPFSSDPLLVYDLGSPWLMDLVTLAYVGMLVAVAGFSYRLIEMPGQRLFRALGQRTAAVWRRQAIDLGADRQAPV